MLTRWPAPSYWNANTSNWDFDYDSYYATYGYPQAGGSGAGAGASSYDAAYAAQASEQASAYGGGGAGSSSTGAYNGASSSANNGEAGAEGRKKYVAGPKDANGNALAGNLKKGETRTTVLRKSVGKLYEDQTLLEWDPTHKRLFVGDLGNDVTDEVLSAAFSKYKSFSKARVVRKKVDLKSKGYGFVAFADPEDFLKAWKEMDGKYIGSRPCRLKKANEDVAPTQIGARKDKLLAANVRYDEFKAKNKMGGAIGGDLRRSGIGKAWKIKR
ncbi:hypothetical protein L7F22_057022 [Adiantum nelumboides]|nr:hypothetical protein [Adiantum nelumboides]